jgi:iron complex outermembrane receptor protein
VWARQLSGDKKGFGLPWAPPASLLLNLSYNPVKVKGLTETVISIDYQLVAAQNQIVPPERKTPGYGVVNLSVGTKINAWKQSVSINVQVVNLTNRRYLSHTSFYRLIGVPEQGRSLILSIQIPLGDKQNE